jgi:capsular polysaccharide biosynthesis protein
VLHTQELGIADQVASVRHARLIAGSAGSAMYSSAFARPGARKLILSPRHFTFRDGQLISHLRGSGSPTSCARRTQTTATRVEETMRST